MRLESPEIKDYFVTDIDDIENWIPEDPDYVDFWLSVTIGLKNFKGGDYFEVHVVTQKQLSQIDQKKHLLIIPSYQSIEHVIELLNQSILDCKDISWHGVANQIAKKYQYEFENYRS